MRVRGQVIGDDIEFTAAAGAEFVRRIIHVDMDAFFASVGQRDSSALSDAVGHDARRCPRLVFIKPSFEVYTVQIRAIVAQYTSIIELLSLDEAYEYTVAGYRHH